jgi:methylthioribose-1-phosphate isomerase
VTRETPPNEEAAKQRQEAAKQRQEAAAARPEEQARPASRDEPAEGADLGRRNFFRAFGREAIHTAASVAGAADALRRGTTAAGAEIIGLGLGTPGALERLRGAVPPGPAEANAAPATAVLAGARATARGVPGEPGTGFHSPYRLETGALLLLDQQQLPGAVQEISCGDGYDVAAAIRDHVAEGAALLGQLAAYGMALTAWHWRDSPPEERDGRLRVAAAALRNARAAPANLEWAVDRMESRWHSLPNSASGDVVADALRAEADAIATEATLDHARLGRLGAEVLRRPRGSPALSLLMLGSVGALAGGSVGTALAVVNAHVADGHEVTVWLAETRPALLGARLTAWELSQAGISYTVVPDSASASLLQSGRVDVVLVGADRIAANGDTLGTIGTYPLAVLASRHGVRFYVCAATPTVDLACTDGATLPEEDRPGGEIASLGGATVIPAGAHMHSPGVDVTPADLIAGFITEQGVLGPPFPTQLAAAANAGRRGRAEPVPA